MTRLDRLRPQPFDHLKRAFIQKQTLDPRILKTYVIYYSQIITLYPRQFPEAYGMLGYCTQQLGDMDKAAAFYQKAIALHENFFWFHYNLAMVYFQTGQYGKARACLREALRQSPEESLAFIFNSKRIYAPLWISDGGGNIEKQLAEGLRSGYGRAAVLSQWPGQQPPLSLDLELF